MAVTHADIAPSPKCAKLGSKTGAFLMVFTILCGLLCFILCLFAEETRSERQLKDTIVLCIRSIFSASNWDGDGSHALC
ncbi:hypothetical protein RJ641_004333 [Dillenia turbinata]|uniref:Uncharacterized protein n=1 Tax=Dillenia turbinata TaxID=194707 RepID=A0AAN8Z853_9MAGN